MFVKKFEAPSLEQALAQIKSELGPNALILSTHEKRGKWFQKSLVEVTAAFERRVKEEMEARFDDTELERIFPHRREEAEREAREQQPKPEAPKNEMPLRRRQPPPSRETPAASAPASSVVSSTYEQEFLDAGFSPDSAKEISRRLVHDYPRKDLADHQFLSRTRAKLIAGPLATLSSEIFSTRTRWIAVGAPGCGKTSFLVKLGLFLKGRGQPVSLVSLDCRKVIGRSEMAAYAKLLKLPFATEAKESAREIQLIDTAALSLEEGAVGWESACQNRAVVLVLDASTRLSEMLKVIERAEPLAPAALAFTRLDLVAEPGVIYDVLKRTKIPLLAVSTSGAFHGAIRFFEPIGLAGFLVKPPKENVPRIRGEA